MKLFKLATATMLALGLGAGAAFAADPIIDPPVLVDPDFNWSGLFLGIKAGPGVVNYTGTVAPNTATWSAPAGLIGGLAGAQMQMGKWVLGVEGDVSWVGANGTVPPILAVGTSSAQWLATFRGKLGIAANRWMFYGTAGVAVLNNNINVNGGALPINNTHLGGVAGLGVNYALTDNMIVGASVNSYGFQPKLYNPDTRPNALMILFDFVVSLNAPPEAFGTGTINEVLTGERR